MFEFGADCGVDQGFVATDAHIVCWLEEQLGLIGAVGIVTRQAFAVVDWTMRAQSFFRDNLVASRTQRFGDIEQQGFMI